MRLRMPGMAKFGQLTMSVGQLPSDHRADLRNGGSLGGRSEGLEPPTPCLQSMAKVSKTVRGTGTERSQSPPGYGNVQDCWCQLWVSSRPAEVQGYSRPASPPGRRMKRLSDGTWRYQSPALPRYFRLGP